MLHQLNIFLHVLAGTLGMLIGIWVYRSKKGGAIHRKYGWIFLYLMGVVVTSALIGTTFFRDRPFLTVISLTSLYTTVSGFRVLKTRSSGFTTWDAAGMLLIAGFAIAFIINLENARILWHKSVIYYTLGSLLAIIAFDFIRFLKPKLIRYPFFWVYDHTYRMSSSFAALISAGGGTIISDMGLGDYTQIIPANLATLWLIFAMFYFPRRYIRKLNSPSATKNVEKSF
ncbi:MAG: hypothetical protein AAF696_06365 [Bacteroidota bacterium]